MSHMFLTILKKNKAVYTPPNRGWAGSGVTTEQPTDTASSRVACPRLKRGRKVPIYGFWNLIFPAIMAKMILELTSETNFLDGNLKVWHFIKKMNCLSASDILLGLNDYLAPPIVITCCGTLQAWVSREWWWRWGRKSTVRN